MRNIDRRGRWLDDPHLEARLVRMPKGEMHFHFEGVFRWSTIRKLHRRGQELPERQPWLAQERPSAASRTLASGIPPIPLKTLTEPGNDETSGGAVPLSWSHPLAQCVPLGSRQEHSRSILLPPGTSRYRLALCSSSYAAF